MQSYGTYGGPAMNPNYGYAEQGMMGRMGQKSPFTQRAKRPTNLAAFFMSLMLPFVIFSAVYSLESLSLHYTDPELVKLLCFALLFFVILLGWFAIRVWLKRDEGSQDPKWYTFLFITAALAWVFGMVFGNKNFQANTSPYYDIVNLGVYTDVNPSQYRGQQLMDAGRIIFTPGSHLDISKSMGFKNLDTYCVAPVTSGNKTEAHAKTTPTVGFGAALLPEYDFWAVGINCCSGHMPDFHCGEFYNGNARSGLRLMRDDQRAYFRLAVQQAEAAYNIQATHPIFMYWMQDPSTEIQAYQDDTYKFWLIGVGAFFGAQLFAVVLATVAFSKLGN